MKIKFLTKINKKYVNYPMTFEIWFHIEKTDERY